MKKSAASAKGMNAPAMPPMMAKSTKGIPPATPGMGFGLKAAPGGNKPADSKSPPVKPTPPGKKMSPSVMMKKKK